jgi:uncharacterized coiled-coil DUF342 family protein
LNETEGTNILIRSFQIIVQQNSTNEMEYGSHHNLIENFSFQTEKLENKVKEYESTLQELDETRNKLKKRTRELDDTETKLQILMEEKAALMMQLQDTKEELENTRSDLDDTRSMSLSSINIFLQRFMSSFSYSGQLQTMKGERDSILVQLTTTENELNTTRTKLSETEGTLLRSK